MKYKVSREFKDKYRRIRYFPGDVYESDEADRIAFLQDAGYLGEGIRPSPGPKKKRVKPDGDS